MLTKPDYGPELSEEERRRRLDWKNGVWYTPEQVMARLKELDAKCSD